MTRVSPDNSDKVEIETWRYKYDILLRLRDHEHTVLWQKFNVFLVFNSIIVTMLSAVLILFKNDNPIIQIFSNGSTVALNNATQYDFSLETLCLFIGCVSIAAFLCSTFSFRILKGSNFWIDFYEYKLRVYEEKTADFSDSKSIIFNDHPSLLLEQIADKGDIDSTMTQTMMEHIHKGYISTRANMRRFVGGVVWIWGVLFVSSMTFLTYQLISPISPYSFTQISGEFPVFRDFLNISIILQFVPISLLILNFHASLFFEILLLLCQLKIGFIVCIFSPIAFSLIPFALYYLIDFIDKSDIRKKLNNTDKGERYGKN